MIVRGVAAPHVRRYRDGERIGAWVCDTCGAFFWASREWARMDAYKCTEDEDGWCRGKLRPAEDHERAAAILAAGAPDLPAADVYP